MNDLLASDRAEAVEALDFFGYQCGRNSGSLAVVPRGVDAVVPNAEMGEHIPDLRERLVQELAWLGAELDRWQTARAALY